MLTRMPVLSRRVRLIALAALVLAGVAFLVVLRFAPQTVTDLGPLDPPGLPGVPDDAEVVLAVGDIGYCEGEADEAVAELAADLEGTIALLGDTVYPEGTETQFSECFEPAWGPMRPRIRPAIGNHEYDSPGADPYFEWFGPAAGSPGEGWYSYDLDEWHVVVLNSNCEEVACGEGSPQLEWLRADLADNPSDCLLAYWHHRGWSSGRHGSDPAVDALWEAVVGAGADVVLAGHEHSYERVEVDGLQEFIVGTGGRSIYRFERDPMPTTAVRHDDSYGLLWLALRDGGFEWQFLPLGLTTFTDSGTGDCT